MNRSWNRTSGKQGQSLVEFALFLPLLVVLLIGAVEIGRAAYYSIAVVNAARSAVQYGAQSSIEAERIDDIKQAAIYDAPMLNPADIEINKWGKYCECPDGFVPTRYECETIPDCCTSLSHGDRTIYYLQVNTEMQLAPLIGFPGLPPSFSLRGEAYMRVGQ